MKTTGPAPAARSLQDVGAMAGARKSVLCVEDHGDTCALLEVVLGFAGYQVKTASSLAEGLRLAGRERFDLYLIDNRLPDGSGVELCCRLREFDPHTPVAFHSGAAYETDRRAAFEAGAQAYLTKPADMDELVREIARLIEKPRPRKPTHGKAADPSVELQG